MSRSALAILLALAGPAAAVEPTADLPLVFVANPTFDMESGVRTFQSLSRVVFLHDAVLADAIDLDEGTAAGKAAGITGRLLKGVFVDVPLVGLQVVFVHEVYGHGGRAREGGLDTTYEFRLVPPYSLLLSEPEPGEAVGSSLVTTTVQLDRDQLVRAGGIESAHLSAWWLNVGMVQRDGWMDHRDMLEYGIDELTYAYSLVGDLGPRDPEGTSNDAENYVTDLQRRFDRWRPEDRAAIVRKLHRAYWFQFVDPTLWQSAFHGLWTWGVQGRPQARFGMLEVGDWHVYPATRFGLSPFGAEHAVDLFALRDGVVFDVYGRGVSSGLASAWGGGARAFGVTVGQRGTMGAELDFWRQPDTLLEDRFVFDRGDRLGANVGVHADFMLHGSLGVVGKVAAKTEGYLMGQPLDRAVYGYLGLSIHP